MAYNLIDELRKLRSSAQLTNSMPAIDNAITLINDVHGLLNRKEWNADTCEALATLLGMYGLECKDVNDEINLIRIGLGDIGGLDLREVA